MHKLVVSAGLITTSPEGGQANAPAMSETQANLRFNEICPGHPKVDELREQFVGAMIKPHGSWLTDFMEKVLKEQCKKPPST